MYAIDMMYVRMYARYAGGLRLMQRSVRCRDRKSDDG